MKSAGVGLLIASLPWLAGGVAPASSLPPLLAYLLFPGRSLLVGLGLFVMIWGLTGRRFAWDTVASGLEALAGTWTFALVALLGLTLVAFARVPQEEKMAEAFGGDEPKYLRIAFSLLRDSDADVSGGRTVTPDFKTRVQQIRHLALTARDTAAGLFKPVAIPEGHVWNAGNWTVRGLDGGLYHLQPPGLPAIVAVALGIGEWVLPERDPGLYVFGLLAVVWVLAAHELWRYAVERTRDEAFSALLVGIVFFSAPVFVGGYQLFPESLALLVFPWLLRRLGASERGFGQVAAIGTGFVTGYLFWVHPKLTVVAVFFALLALVRPATAARSKALFVAAFALTAFTALLYCYGVSGLFRPEGLYIRQAEEYVGSPNPLSLRFIAGLIKGLVGGRDGLLFFAPILVLGFMRGGSTWRLTRPMVEMAALFGVVWLTSAVHDGASLGSPSRLMAPVVFVPAFFLVQSVRSGASVPMKAAALLLFVYGGLVTQTMNADWRRNVNPFKTMFANPATNFERDLPGNSFSNPAYVVDIEKAALILIVVALGAAALRRRADEEDDEWTAARFGLGVLTMAVVLAFGLHALSPPV